MLPRQKYQGYYFFTFIEPWNALAPTNASTARMPSDALKDRWEYRRWYPIVILFNVQKDAI